MVPGVYYRIGADYHARVYVSRVRVDDGHAGAHVSFVYIAPDGLLSVGQVHARGLELRARLLEIRLALRHWRSARNEWRTHRFEAVGVALLVPLSYILVLTALQFTPVSYVAPAREISILIGTVMGTHFLSEGDVRRRLIAAGSMVLGVVGLAVG